MAADRMSNHKTMRADMIAPFLRKNLWCLGSLWGIALVAAACGSESKVDAGSMQPAETQRAALPCSQRVGDTEYLVVVDSGIVARTFLDNYGFTYARTLRFSVKFGTVPTDSACAEEIRQLAGVESVGLMVYPEPTQE